MSGLRGDYRADLRRTLGREARRWEAVALPWCHAGLRAALCYRLGHRALTWPGGRVLAGVLKRVGLWTTGAEIHPAARLAGGLHLPHPHGVVIGPTVTTRGECAIFQGVTLGPRRTDGDPEDGPTLERLTFVYAGARVLGRVRVGARAQIGPNCVVYRDLPAGSTVLAPEPRVLEGLSFQLRERLAEETVPAATAATGGAPA